MGNRQVKEAFSTTERKVHHGVLSFKSINLDNTIINPRCASTQRGL